MKWMPELTLEQGQAKTVDSHLGPLTIQLKGEALHYSHPDFKKPESEKPISKIFLMESLGERVNLTFRPLYPDRPIVFKLEDSLSIPPGEDGFFVLTMPVAVGMEIQRTETILEELLPKPRKQTYWGPPQDGLLAYEVRSTISTDALERTVSTDTATAVVPVWFRNRYEEMHEIKRCLVPIQELDLYRNDEDDLVFEVVSLVQQEEFYQEPKPLKRPPKEMKQRLNHYLTAPNQAQTLFERVKGLPRLDHITSVFMNR